jgi:hypothetical protein
MIEVQTLYAAGIPISHTPEHRETAEVMAEAVEVTADVLQSRWGLGVPANCSVHVLTDWAKFIDETTPSRLRIFAKLSKPLWRRRAERMYAVAGGWTIPWRGQPAVGVKPAELLSRSEPSLGDELFVRVTDPLEKVRYVTCHELTHAFTAHLRLPPWLNEGVAMRAVDHLAGHPTVLEETRSDVEDDPSVFKTREYLRLARRDHRALLRVYTTGYWVVRSLDEGRPSSLKDMLGHRRSQRAVAENAMMMFRSVEAFGGAS